MLESYEELYAVAANHKCEKMNQSLISHRKYGGNDGDTDFGGNNDEGDDGFDDGFNGGGGMARRSRRVMQSRYTGFSNSAVKREYGASGFMGAEMIKSEIMDTGTLELLKSRYSSIEKDRSMLQKKCEELEKGLIQSKNLMEGLEAEGKTNSQVEVLRISLTNQINALEQENARIRRDYEEVQNRRQNSVEAGSQNNQNMVERAKRQVTDEYERKIKSMEEAHRREIEKLNKEHELAIKKSIVSSTLKGAGDRENIEGVKKQLTDDFDRRLKRIQDDHLAQIEKLRNEHKQTMSKSRVGQDSS